MRLPGSRDCGDLLSFDEVRRRLDLGMPQHEADAAIRIADVIGTVDRIADFDRCFRPRRPHLEAVIAQIRRQRPRAAHEPIDVIRVDRAYFVVDGHKRLAIAHATGMEFIDARVSHASSRYALAPGVEPEAIDLTAAEQRFRSETALLAAAPAARFAVSRVECFAELKEAIESYGYELSQRCGRLLGREEVAAVWYETVYRPTVTAAKRQRLDELLPDVTEADLFLVLHRQSRQLWGSECRIAEEDADHIVAKVIALGAIDDSVIGQLVRRARRRRRPQLLEQRPAPA